MVEFDDLWNSLCKDLYSAFHKYRGRISELNISVKPDKTLLTDADIEIEDLIVNYIRTLDPNAVLVTEEDERDAPRAEVRESPEIVWVIDPIDGTAEFVRAGHVEFCSVVCVLRHMTPVAALIYAPELGPRRTPLMVTVDRPSGTVKINGTPVPVGHRRHHAKWASVTRSTGVPPRSFERFLESAGYRLKTRTTSQTIDMVRTALDIEGFTEQKLPSFDIFHRTNQKAWDGLAGMCLGETIGLSTIGVDGRNLLPVSPLLLSQPEPKFASTIMAPPDVAEWFLKLM